MFKKSLLAAASLAAMLSAPLAGTMRAFDLEMPAFSGSARAAKARIERDGIGRRVKPKAHPRHNSQKRASAREFASFREKVEATHSFNEDPRDDKYLHSHARMMRGLRRSFGAAA